MSVASLCLPLGDVCLSVAVDISENLVGDEGLSRVAAAIKGGAFRALRVLRLSSNEIRDEGVVALAGELPMLTELEDLEMDKSPRRESNSHGTRGVAHCVLAR